MDLMSPSDGNNPGNDSIPPNGSSANYPSTTTTTTETTWPNNPLETALIPRRLKKPWKRKKNRNWESNRDSWSGRSGTKSGGRSGNPQSQATGPSSAASSENIMSVVVRRHVTPVAKDYVQSIEIEDKRLFKRRRRHAYYCNRKCWDPLHCVHPHILVQLIIVLLTVVAVITIIIFEIYRNGCRGRCNSCPCSSNSQYPMQYVCKCWPNRTGSECQYLDPCALEVNPCEVDNKTCLPMDFPEGLVTCLPK